MIDTKTGGTHRGMRIGSVFPAIALWLGLAIPTHVMAQDSDEIFVPEETSATMEAVSEEESSEEIQDSGETEVSQNADNSGDEDSSEDDGNSGETQDSGETEVSQNADNSGEGEDSGDTVSSDGAVEGGVIADTSDTDKDSAKIVENQGATPVVSDPVEDEKKHKQYVYARHEADVLSKVTLNPDRPDTAQQSASEKAIAVIERRPFEKAGRTELALGIGTIASDLFVAYFPISLRGGYHFKEWISLELTASFMGCFSDEVGDGLQRGGAQKCLRGMTSSYDHLKDNAPHTQLRNVTVEQYQTARFALNPIYSPFNGKFSLMNDAIVHYDLNVTAGLGVQILETLDQTNIGKIKYGASFEGNFGLGLRFVFVDFVGLRLDFREYLYGKKRNKSLGTASEFGLSVSFLL